MPGVFARYYPATDPKARELDSMDQNERATRKAMIDAYWRYYVGDHKKPLKVERDQPDDNVIINLCGQAVDKAVAFMSPKAPKIQVEGEDSNDDKTTPEQQALDDFWEANDLGAFVTDLGLSGFISGHPFVRLMPADENDEQPTVALLDARHVSVFWDISNIRRVLWYRLEWQMPNEDVRRQDIVADWVLGAEEVDLGDGNTQRVQLTGVDTPKFDPLSTWTIIEYERSRSVNGNQWREVGRDPWPYPFAPIKDWKNNPMPHEYYGQADLKHARLNDSVNFIASNTARIIKYHASPRTILTGATLGELVPTAVNGVWELPNPEAKVTTLEMAGDLGSSMAMMETLRSAFFTEGRVVDWASQKDKVGQLTNFGLRVLFNDMLDMIEGKQKRYGDGLAEISRRALVIKGFADAKRPDVKFEPALPTDRMEAVTAAVQENTIGATSKRTLITDLGRDYDQEQDWKKDEQQSNDELMANTLVNINRMGAFNNNGNRNPNANGFGGPPRADVSARR